MYLHIRNCIFYYYTLHTLVFFIKISLILYKIKKRNKVNSNVTYQITKIIYITKSICNDSTLIK